MSADPFPIKRQLAYEPCYFCQDLGVVRAVSTDGSHETLMRCECSDDFDKSNWKLPKWTREWAPLYEKHRCPVSWFKPQKLEFSSDGVAKSESLTQKIDYWKAKVSIAEAFWVHQKMESEK